MPLPVVSRTKVKHESQTYANAAKTIEGWVDTYICGTNLGKNDGTREASFLTDSHEFDVTRYKLSQTVCPLPLLDLTVNTVVFSR